MTETDYGIRVEGVSRDFGPVRALHEVDFEVEVPADFAAVELAPFAAVERADQGLLFGVGKHARGIRKGA